MKNFLRFLSYVLVAALASCLTLVTAPMLQTVAGQSKLDQLSDLIREQFIGTVDVTAMEDAAAHAMVNALGDRWSYYLPADQYSAYVDRMNNSYVGIGVTVQAEEDQSGFLVKLVTKGGPAEESGILVGDKITGVDGKDAAGIDVNEVAQWIKGEEGTAVELTLDRAGETLTVTVVRRQIQTVVASGQMLPGNVGLVTIENFDKRCKEETIAAITDLVEQGAVALIFDVRNNPGGYVSQLVAVLDHLLPEGDLFKSVYYDGREYMETSDADCIDLPMAVLVNEESYSAAAFFAAAIREYEAGFVAGNQTCGKGYFQVNYKLDDGSAVGLSIGKYYTPKGVSLAEAGGVTPDLVVEVDDEMFAAIYADTVDPMEDPQILAALERLLGK